MDNSQIGTPESHEQDNYNFVQVSRAYLKEWRALTRKSPIASEIWAGQLMLLFAAIRL